MSVNNPTPSESSPPPSSPSPSATPPDAPPPTPDEKELAEARRNTAFNWMIALAAIAVFALKFPDLTQTLFVFIITLGVLVFVHEWGHYQFGRWAGMKVNRFGIGFPPWIYTKRKNGIDYSVGALPIGGMVDIAGLGSEEEMVATAKRDEDTLSQSQRAARANIPHGKKLFQDASLGWRFLTLFAGPLMNFVFAILVFIFVYSVWGIIDGEKSKVVSRIAAVRLNDPADKAGLEAGDRIVGVNGIKTTDPETISNQIEDSARIFADTAVTQPQVAFTARALAGAKPIEPVQFSIERDGQVFQKEITPILTDKEYLQYGVLDSRRAPAVGIEFDQDLVFQKVGIGEAIQTGLRDSFGMTYQLVRVLGRAFTFQLTDAEKRSIGGPVAIARAVGRAARNGIQEALVFAGLLSVNLGLMNLLPFPALDGGRILFLGYELVFRRPLDARKESLVHMAGMVMLLAFMLFITVRDVLPWIERSLRNVF